MILILEIKIHGKESSDIKVTLVVGDKKILIFADIGSIYNSVACLKSLLLTINYISKFCENVRILYLLLGKEALNFIGICTGVMDL